MANPRIAEDAPKPLLDKALRHVSGPISALDPRTLEDTRGILKPFLDKALRPITPSILESSGKSPTPPRKFAPAIELQGSRPLHRPTCRTPLKHSPAARFSHCGKLWSTCINSHQSGGLKIARCPLLQGPRPAGGCPHQKGRHKNSAGAEG